LYHDPTFSLSFQKLSSITSESKDFISFEVIDLPILPSSSLLRVLVHKKPTVLGFAEIEGFRQAIINIMANLIINSKLRQMDYLNLMVVLEELGQTGCLSVYFATESFCLGLMLVLSRNFGRSSII